MNLQGIRLLVEDFDTSFRFYSEILEFKVTWGKYGDVYASFDTGNHIGLSIFTASYMDEALGIEPSEKRRLADNCAIIFEVSDLDFLYEKLKTKDVKVLKKPTPMPGWGIMAMHIRDAEGNLIEFNCDLPKEQWDEDLANDALQYEESIV